MTSTSWEKIKITLQPSSKLHLFNHIRKSRDILLSDPQLSLYITQPKLLTQEGAGRDLIIENPIFKPYSFKMEGNTGRIDDKRTRYSFDCAFRDLGRESKGRIQSLIIFTDKNDAFFESFTVLLETPIEKVFRIQDIEIEENGEKPKWNRPRRTIAVEQASQEEQMDAKYRR